MEPEAAYGGSNGAIAVWSPDDQLILFHRDGNLWVTDLSGNTEQLTSDGANRGVHSWIH